MLSLILLLALGQGADSLVVPGKPLEFQGSPGGIYAGAISKEGQIFLAYPKSGSVLRFDFNGKALPAIGKKGQGPGEFNWPAVIFFDAPYLYVCDTAQDRLFRIDPNTGTFLQSWSLKGITAFSVNKNQFLGAFVDPEKAHVFGTATLGHEKSVAFDRYLGQKPCCLEVSGSHRGAVLQDSEGNNWVSYTGEFLLQKYNGNGELLKSNALELPGYVKPSQPKSMSRFDTTSLSANVRSFDKINALFEVGDRIVLYRYKVRMNAYIDVFERSSGQRIETVKSDGLKPIGVFQGKLIALQSFDDDTAAWDVRLSTLNL